MRSLWLLVFFSWPLFAESVYYMEPVARVRGEIRLSHIARIDGSARDEVLFRSLEEPYFLSKSEFEKHVRGAMVYGQGTWIVPLNRTVSGSELSGMLRQAVERLPGGTDFLSRHTIAVRGSLETTAQGSGTVFRLPARAASLTPGRRIIPADLVVPENGQERTLHRTQLDVQILKRAKVLVALRDLSPGHRLGPGDYRVEWRELDEDLRLADETAAGYTVLSEIKEGGMILSRSLARVRAVRRGQTVQALFRKGSVTIRCRALAMGDAEIGQELPVRILLPSGRKTDILKADAGPENTVFIRP